jgi:bacterioferritin
MPSKSPDHAELIAGLNEDLANEYASVIQYRTFASTVRGPHRPTLRSMFAAEIPEELSHAELLADRIAALGGTPTTRPAPVNTATSPVSMLEQALEAEVEAVARYIQRRAQAEALGEHGLAVDLDDVIAEETRHRDEIHLVLEGWDEAAQPRESAVDRGRREPSHRRETADHEHRMAARQR